MVKPEKILPFSDYAPWNEDEAFLQTYAEIESSTLVDKYRCYELWSLVETCAKLPRGAILEVGVWRGGSGMLMAKKAAACGLKEPVYLCDSFKGVEKAGLMDPLYRGGEHDDASKEMVEALQHKMKLTNVHILEGIFPDETASQVSTNEFRLCHIDVDVYDSAKESVDWIWDKLVVGGMIVFDDYGFTACGGVTNYVNFFKDFKNLHYFYNLNGHAILIKLSS